MYRKLIKPILFAMNIERAHSTVLFLLRMIGKIPGGRALLRAIYRTEHPSLEREVFGLRLPNPIGLAAGFDRNGEAFRELSALGFGFVEIGTVTPQPQAGSGSSVSTQALLKSGIIPVAWRTCPISGEAYRRLAVPLATFIFTFER